MRAMLEKLGKVKDYLRIRSNHPHFFIDRYDQKIIAQSDCLRISVFYDFLRLLD